MRKRDDERRRKDPFPWPDGHWWVQVVGYVLKAAMIGGAAFVTYLLYLQIKAGAPMH